MEASPKTPWLEAGYTTFALEGPQALKVERLAKTVGKNKSSFYHHFADLEVFTALLLEQHMHQVHEIARKEADSSSQSELVSVMVAHKRDLLFNRQLRIHRDHPDFEACFVKTNEITAKSIAPLWMSILGLEDNSYLAGLVLKLSFDNFFLQISDETLTEDWLNAYFGELRCMVAAFKEMGSLAALNGTV